MPYTYQVGPLTAEQVDPAYCVARLFAGALSLEQWRSFCRAVLEREGQQGEHDQIHVATNARGYIHGLCIGSATMHPRRGRMLDVWFFAVMSVGDEAGLAGEMVQYLRAVAKAGAFDGLRIQTFGQAALSRHLDLYESEHPDDGLPMVLEPHAFIPGSLAPQPMDLPVKT
ncbi:hypothetical protein D3874_18755 [Oleomonas cavernae]|uniref:GNAT family N-acetyltransferase n=1 Tax=Oleomonas cavernae TaxID=2320859 RepID=A0A418WFH8_9PROT|nr:hypothetical protein [Oleomonas cavernae]RJF88774.1 hypothetical protein D3874_18755 [Oleomonas cavernae]